MTRSTRPLFALLSILIVAVLAIFIAPTVASAADLTPGVSLSPGTGYVSVTIVAMDTHVISADQFDRVPDRYGDGYHVRWRGTNTATMTTGNTSSPAVYGDPYGAT